jgi:hypothetical protein
MGELIKMEKSLITIQRVNQCQLFLQITWLSEMTDPLGTTILPDFLRFTGTHTDHSISTLKWPIQKLPPKKSWEIWRKLIRKQFLLSKRGCLGVAIWKHHLDCSYQPTTTIAAGIGNKQEQTPL